MRLVCCSLEAGQGRILSARLVGSHPDASGSHLATRVSGHPVAAVVVFDLAHPGEVVGEDETAVPCRRVE